MWSSTNTTTSIGQFWGLISNTEFLGEKNIPTSEIEENLKQQLIEMGYSKKAIKEIFKFFSTI